MISQDGTEYREVTCGDCGRPVFHREDGTLGLGWIAPCGRRIAHIEACSSGNFCAPIGGVKFDTDGALLTDLRADRPMYASQPSRQQD